MAPFDGGRFRSATKATLIVATGVVAISFTVTWGCSRPSDEISAGGSTTAPVAEAETIATPTEPALTPIETDEPYRFPLHAEKWTTVAYEVDRFLLRIGGGQSASYRWKGRLEILTLDCATDARLTQIWKVGDFRPGPFVPENVRRVYQLQAGDQRLDLRFSKDLALAGIELLNGNTVLKRFENYFATEYPDDLAEELQYIESLENGERSLRLIDFALPEAAWFFAANAETFSADGRQSVATTGRIGGLDVDLRFRTEWIVEGLDSTKKSVTIRCNRKADTGKANKDLEGKVPDEERLRIVQGLTTHNVDSRFVLDVDSGWPIQVDDLKTTLEDGATVRRYSLLRRIESK
jgi:hypothetical protein